MVNAEQLIKLLRFNLENKKFDNAVKLLDDEEYNKIILEHYPDVIQEVLMKHLTTDNYSKESVLYEVCEAILKLLAEKCHQEGILFEFLEIIETVKDDDVFTSILKCLQVVVLKQSDKKSRALEYCLNSIEEYVIEMPLPIELLKNIEEEEEKILENDEQIRRILMMYMTLNLFYEPIVAQIANNQPTNKLFKSNKLNRRNVLFCFILRLLGKPLSFLDLSYADTKKMKTYSREIAERIVKTLCKLRSDVFQLLQYLEIRNRWPNKTTDDLENIFLYEEKTPLNQLGILFYLIIAEEVSANQLPQIYSKIYIFQMGIYAVNNMLTSDDAAAYKGLKLGLKMLDDIEDQLSSSELDLDIHRTFCNNLIKTLLYSSSKRNRKNSLKLMRDYILKFDIHGRYLLIKNILKISNHKGLSGYLTTLYKDIIFEELNSGTMTEFTCGLHFKELFLEQMCKLEGGVKCDIADSSDQINASLNFLIALFIRDKENATGIKNLAVDIEEVFLKELRSALNLSRAHYLAETENVKAGKSKEFDEIIQGTEIVNDSEPLKGLNCEQKLNMLLSALGMFDLIDYQLARCSEVIKRAM